MALWGNNDNVTSAGVVTVSYDDLTVTGDGTAFGAAGSAQVGNVIRFGFRGDKVSAGTTYFGDAVISGITSATLLSIASTAGLSGAAIGGAGGTDFYVSELPSSTVGDFSYSEKNSGYDKVVYGISDATSQLYDGSSSEFRTSGSGWVGVTTYMDRHNNLRVKSEILVATSGITTGSNGIAYPTNE